MSEIEFEEVPRPRVELGGVSGGDQCERHAMLADGTEVLCMKSYGHDTIYRPGDPRRQHFDVSEERGWTPVTSES